MKNKLLLVISIILLTAYTNVYCEFDEWYYYESVTAFISSPNQEDLEKIEDENTRYCEQVYLEATRRRPYTNEEIEKCTTIFEIKRQQEIDYMYFVLWNRGIFY